MELIEVKGVGPKTLLKFHSLGIYTIDDLVRFMPKFYFDMTKEGDLLNSDHGDYLLLKGKILKKTKLVQVRRGLNFFRAEMMTQGFKVKLIWYNSPFILSQIQQDKEYVVWGKISKKRKELEIPNPSFELLEESKRLQGIVPIYPLRGILGQQMFRNVLQEALRKEEIKTVIDKYSPITLHEGLKLLHFPFDMEDVKIGKQRFDLENLILQYIAYRQNRNTVNDLKIKKYNKNIDEIFPVIRSLPYELTPSQSKAINEIILDLKNPKRTNRMLLGDVGSGKTIVAFLAAVYAIKNGYQVAIMVPTEILAIQHYIKAKDILEKFGIRIGLLVGSSKAKDKRLLQEGLENATIDLVIGTHSLLNDKITFSNLSLVIIDELHKFGVKQKGTLEEKSLNCDVISMSATPIPRAIALSIYGDLAMSQLEPRKGTQQVDTFIIPDEKIEAMWDFVYERVKNGEQAYIVCPLVVDSEGLEVYSAKTLYKELQLTNLKDTRIGLVYGSMKETEKNKVMKEFYDKNMDILVATSVVEVGIDSEAASIMIVLNADRFGLASLHQLRGRVGRKAGLHSYCFLHTSRQDENVRLSALKNNSNGSDIAEIDASIRGYGDFLGIRQSGGNMKNQTIITKDLIIQSKDIADKLMQEKSFDITSLAYIQNYLDTIQKISLN